MYRAVVFDLDGTLVQTEKLKAESYGEAAAELSDGHVTPEAVVEAFRDVVGRSRREVSSYLLERFDLEGAARDRMAENDVERPWQVLARLRFRIYDEMLQDPDVIRKNQWPHNVELLKRVRQNNCTAALATMSYCEQVLRILTILELRDHFDFVASRDDVENPKPHPEIYLLVASELKVPPAECLVIEDSPAGVQAAQAAGMDVIAVTTPFTRQAFREKDLLDRRWVVDEPSELPKTLTERHDTLGR
jgi:HAD superfamily hydrolase (TIGR01509 family)